MEASAIVDALTTAYTGWLESKRQAPVTTRTHVWASGRRRCKRAMCLDLMHPEDAGEIDADGLARMHRGSHRELDIVTDLMQIGPRSTPPFQVVEGQQRVEIKDRDGTLLITGKIDGKLLFHGLPHKVPFECKSGQTFQRVEVLEDLERSPWTRHAPDQLLSYCLAESLPIGLLVIDRPGLPLFLPMLLEEHLDRAEGFMRDARVAIDAKNGVIQVPPFIDDPSECRRCQHFGKSCAPPLDFGPGLRIINDPVLEGALEARERTHAAHAEYERADRQLKKLRGVREALIGPFHYRGHWEERKTLELPPDVEQQFKEIKAELERKYTKRKAEGAWFVEVDRVPVSD